MHKCKASCNMAAGHRINRKVAINDKDSPDGSEVFNFKPNMVELPAQSSNNDAGKTEPDEDCSLGYTSTKAMGDPNCEVSPFSFLQKWHDILTLIRHPVELLRVITLPIFTPSFRRRMNISNPTLVQKMLVIFANSVGKRHQLFAGCLHWQNCQCSAKASPQKISSSKVMGLCCIHILHGKCNNDTLCLYHANNLVFRHKDHFKLYEDHCKKLNIPLYPYAIHPNTPSALNRYYRFIIYNIAMTLLILLPVKEVLTM